MNTNTLVFSQSGRRWIWHEGWAALPEPMLGVRNLRTHGVKVLADGRIVVFHQATPSVLIYGSDGTLQSRFGAYPGAHGLTLVRRAETDFLWLTDEMLGSVDLVDLEGLVHMRLEKPSHAVCRDSTFAPTWVAEQSDSAGNPERLWVADGYGAMLVHAYSAEGCYEFTLDGTTGAGRFQHPHGLAVDPRTGRDQRLLVADRGNRRVQEFASDGRFLGTWGDDFLIHPNGFDFRNGQCVISELHGRLTVIDEQNRPVDFLGDQPNARFLAGWPDVNRTQLLQPGLFNSPHHACWGLNGEIYAVEWVKGGRLVRWTR